MKEMEKMGPKGPVGTKDKAGAKGEGIIQVSDQKTGKQCAWKNINGE